MRLWVLSLVAVSSIASGQTSRLPIIDMHMHANPAPAERGWACSPSPGFAPPWDPIVPFDEFVATLRESPGCEDPIWSPSTDQEMTERNMAMLEKHNVIAVLSSGPRVVSRYIEAEPDRILRGQLVPMIPGIDLLPQAHELLRFDVIGEITAQYSGVEPGDPMLEPIWALAEEADVPVGIHIGPGPSGVTYRSDSALNGYRLQSPLLLEEVLERHPRIRVYVMHAGWPFIDDMIAVLQAHPQVYVDIAAINWSVPRDEFYGYLQRLIRAGFGKRIMYGSDQGVFPELIERAIAVVEAAPFLGEQEKRDIFYNNAARFLRLTSEQIAQHHAL